MSTSRIGTAVSSVRPPRILYWCETTARQPFETGIQRVTRRLGAALAHRGADVVPLGWDTGRRLPASLDGRPLEALLPAAWLIVPEIPISVLAEDRDPLELGQGLGLRCAAIVHDLIPIKLADLYGAADTALYRRYYRMFAAADRVLATTEVVAGDLRRHLDGAGLRVPDIAVVALPAQFADMARREPDRGLRTSDAPLRLLTVSTWEPRKNLPRLMRAVRAAARAGGRQIHLTIVGRRSRFADYDRAVTDLAADMPGVTILERESDAALAALYAAHDAGVYPSLEEGFGLPIVESLWLGRPCLCHTGSAMAEVAPGGGTVMVDMTDEGAIASAIERLAKEPALLARLSAEIAERPLRNWSDYAADITAVLDPEVA